MPRKRELKNEVFLYVKSIEINKVKDLPERRSRLKICISDLPTGNRNVIENLNLI